jgi:hypothetical protein
MYSVRILLEILNIVNGLLNFLWFLAQILKVLDLSCMVGLIVCSGGPELHLQ